MLRDSRQHIPPKLVLVQIERRSRDIQQYLPSRSNQVFHRIDAIQAAVPEVLVIPRILADGEGEWGSVDRDEHLLVSRREVARLVKHVIRRQKPLGLEGCNLSVAKQGGRIQNRLTGD